MVHAACWTDSNPIRVQSDPVAPNIVLYEWHVKHRTGTDIIVTDINILETSSYGLDDNPIQVSVIQRDDQGNSSPESPRSDFIFAFPPYGTDLNGDGKTNFNDDYLGKPYLTGMSATMGCKSCALPGQCPAPNPISPSMKPYLLSD